MAQGNRDPLLRRHVVDASRRQYERDPGEGGYGS